MRPMHLSFQPMFSCSTLQFQCLLTSLPLCIQYSAWCMLRQLPAYNMSQIKLGNAHVTTETHDVADGGSDPTLPASSFPCSPKAFRSGPASSCGRSSWLKGAGLEFRTLNRRVAGFAMMPACCCQSLAVKSSLSFGLPGTQNPAQRQNL